MTKREKKGESGTSSSHNVSSGSYSMLSKKKNLNKPILFVEKSPEVKSSLSSEAAPEPKSTSIEKPKTIIKSIEPIQIPTSRDNISALNTPTDKDNELL